MTYDDWKETESDDGKAYTEITESDVARLVEEERAACEAIARDQIPHTAAFSPQFNGGWTAAAKHIAGAIAARKRT